MVDDGVAINRFLDRRSAADIDRAVGRVLRDLDYPEPPLRLEVVRELLHLDRHFYSASEDGVLRETIHRVRVGAQQVARRPTLLLDVVRKKKLKALWIPDRRRILIDETLPPPKIRWGEAHEIGHSLIEWHEPLTHGDQRRTLSPACEIQIEGEANYAAGRLLFLQDIFVEHVKSMALDLSTVRDLAKVYGNTITSTLWRAVESVDQAAFGMISQHPRPDMVEAGSPLARYFIRSPSFATKFAPVTSDQVYRGLRGFCWGRRGPIGKGELVLRDCAGEDHGFLVECFYNGHEALTLGVG